MTLRIFSLLSAFVLLLTLPAAALAQGPKKESSDTVARPRKKDAPAEETQEKIPSKLNKKQELPTDIPVFRSDVTTVTVDVAVIDNKGRFLPGIPKAVFRVMEDNVPQQVREFTMGGEAPMTICMVIEFSNLYQQYWSNGWYETLQASYGFLQTLKPEDYVAIVAYDLRPEILSDFSTDKQKAMEGMQRLRIPGFSESNLYDAVVDTAERMSEIEGRKAIFLIASGMDTFSKLTFDQTRRRLQAAGIPIYSFGIMQALREWYDARGMLGPIARLDFLQADNQMRTFAKETGGMSFFPRFFGEFPGIFNAVQQTLRSQCTLTYSPANQERDGKYRRIKVELVNPATGEPLILKDEKDKPIKYQIIAKQGYTAPRAVE
jgi:Ca-activated chloride channel homolog